MQKVNWTSNKIKRKDACSKKWRQPHQKMKTTSLIFRTINRHNKLVLSCAKLKSYLAIRTIKICKKENKNKKIKCKKVQKIQFGQLGRKGQKSAKCLKSSKNWDHDRQIKKQNSFKSFEITWIQKRYSNDRVLVGKLAPNHQLWRNSPSARASISNCKSCLIPRQTGGI